MWSLYLQMESQKNFKTSPFLKLFHINFFFTTMTLDYIQKTQTNKQRKGHVSLSIYFRQIN